MSHDICRKHMEIQKFYSVGLAVNLAAAASAEVHFRRPVHLKEYR